VRSAESSLYHFGDFQNLLGRHLELYVATTSPLANLPIECTCQMFERFNDCLVSDSALGGDGKITEGTGTGRDPATDIRVLAAMVANLAQTDRNLM
tara:strand:- start:49290 stop:49577 length:288 start_codon:yes stop_codon:yes gene_type:complete